MAERLTERKTTKGITYTIQPHIENNLVIYKLGLLEDIMEKYGIEGVEEIEKKLAYYIDKFIAEIELYTWKRACELACEEIDCEYMYGVNKENYAHYFYQQAKKEGEK